MTIEIRPITAEQTLPIRHHVLWPHKPVAFSRVEDDERGHHFGAFAGDKLVCVASLFADGRRARLRKFATLPDYQGQGIGSQMVSYLIGRLRQSPEFTGVDTFWCDARVSATGFYRRFSMAPYGEQFFKSDVPYVKMRRAISGG